jgi:hypothetical protein
VSKHYYDVSERGRFVQASRDRCGGGGSERRRRKEEKRKDYWIIVIVIVFELGMTGGGSIV